MVEGILVALLDGLLGRLQREPLVLVQLVDGPLAEHGALERGRAIARLGEADGRLDVLDDVRLAEGVEQAPVHVRHARPEQARGGRVRDECEVARLGDAGDFKVAAGLETAVGRLDLGGGVLAQVRLALGLGLGAALAHDKALEVALDVFCGGPLGLCLAAAAHAVEEAAEARLDARGGHRGANPPRSGQIQDRRAMRARAHRVPTGSPASASLPLRQLAISSSNYVIRVLFSGNPLRKRENMALLCCIGDPRGHGLAARAMGRVARL